MKDIIWLNTYRFFPWLDKTEGLAYCIEHKDKENFVWQFVTGFYKDTDFGTRSFIGDLILLKWRIFHITEDLESCPRTGFWALFAEQAENTLNILKSLLSLAKSGMSDTIGEVRSYWNNYNINKQRYLNIYAASEQDINDILKAYGCSQNDVNKFSEYINQGRINYEGALQTVSYPDVFDTKEKTGYNVFALLGQFKQALSQDITGAKFEIREDFREAFYHKILNDIKANSKTIEAFFAQRKPKVLETFVQHVGIIESDLLSGIKDTKSNIQEGLWDVRRSELEFERERWEQMMQIVYARGNKEWTRAELKFLKAWRKWRKEFDEKFKEGLEKWNRVVKNLEQSRDRWVAQLLREGVKQRSAELARKYLNQIEKQVKAATGRLPARINLRPEDFIPNIPKVATIQSELALWAGQIDTQVEATLADSDLGQMAHHIKAAAGRAQLIRRYTQAFERFIIDRMIDQFNKRKEALQKALYEIEENVRKNYEKSFAQTESGSYKGAITGGMQRKVVEDVTILGKVTDFISWDTVNKLLSSGMNKEEVTEKLPEWKVIDKKKIELQTTFALEPSKIARMAPEDASFLIECLMNRLQEEFEQKQEEIYKHAGAFKGQDLTIPLGSKTIKIQGGTGEVGHISEKFIENEQKAAVGKFRLKEPYWRHRIFDDDYDNDGKPDISWLASPTVKDAAKILANAIPGAGPALSFLIDAGDALYSGLVEHNWSAAAGLAGQFIGGMIPGGGSIFGQIAGNFMKAGLSQAGAIIAEAASKGWDFKKVQYGKYLLNAGIGSLAQVGGNILAGKVGKLFGEFGKAGIGEALKLTTQNVVKNTVKAVGNELGYAIQAGKDYRFGDRAGRFFRSLGAAAGMGLVETGIHYIEEGLFGKPKIEEMDKIGGLNLKEAARIGLTGYIYGFSKNVMDRWVEDGELTVEEVREASAYATKDVYRQLGEYNRWKWVKKVGERTGISRVMGFVKGLIGRGIEVAWEGLKAAARGLPRLLVGDLIGAMGATTVYRWGAHPIVVRRGGGGRKDPKGRGEDKETESEKSSKEKTRDEKRSRPEEPVEKPDEKERMKTVQKLQQQAKELPKHLDEECVKKADEEFHKKFDSKRDKKYRGKPISKEEKNYKELSREWWKIYIKYERRKAVELLQWFGNWAAGLMELEGRDREEFLRALYATAYQESRMSHHKKDTHEYNVYQNPTTQDRGFMQINSSWDGKRIQIDFDGDGVNEVDFTVDYEEIDNLAYNIFVGTVIFADEYRHAREYYFNDKKQNYKDIAEAAYGGYNGGRDDNKPYKNLSGDVREHVKQYRNWWRKCPWANKEDNPDIYDLF